MDLSGACRLTLRNSGRGRLDLTGVTVQGAQGTTFRFSVPGQNAILPGQHCCMVFQPGAAGPGERDARGHHRQHHLPHGRPKGLGVDALASLKEDALDFGKIPDRRGEASPAHPHQPGARFRSR